MSDNMRNIRLAVYQFGVSYDVQQNLTVIKGAVRQAVEEKADIIVFPECALTGYPSKDIKAADIDTDAAEDALKDIKEMSDGPGISILVGTVVRNGNEYHNRAYLFVPGKPQIWYDKRALYGWDEENFKPGIEKGIFDINGVKIGVRICFEVRFPEYFRELYRAGTDLDIVLFYDVSDKEDENRYRMIKSHLITRAVENVTPILSVNAIRPYQTAPTCYINASGAVCKELEKDTEGMLIYDFKKQELNFGEIGRKRYSDMLLGL